MSDNKSWTDQWFKAQQQFVDAWSDMAKAGDPRRHVPQTDLWADGFEAWRRAVGGESRPDMRDAMAKCFDMGREYFSMAEKIGRNLADGKEPRAAINQWMEQLKQGLQQWSNLSGLDSAAAGDFMKQWFAPSKAWQQMASQMAPMQQAMWQMPGMTTPVFNLGEAVDPLGRMLEAPGIGYFREPQEKQQRGIQLALEYHEANFKFNQAFLRIAIESIEGFQQRMLQLDSDAMPKTLRGLYDLWVEVSEEHYAEFAMSEEYQALYGDMVNKLMVLKKHYHDIIDDQLRLMNMPNSREVDTMQQRIQQLRRDNIAMKKELAEIRSLLGKRGAAAAAKTAAPPKIAAEPAPAATANASAPAVKRAVAKKTAAKKPAAKKPAAAKKKSAVSRTSATRSKAGA